MDYSEEEILAVFKDKICLYKESQRITQVLVKNIKVDDWGVKLDLEICNSKQADNFHGDLEYEEKPEELNKVFRFSGTWEVVSFNDMRLHVAYVNGELNANTKSSQLFNDKEPGFFKLWQAK